VIHLAHLHLYKKKYPNHGLVVIVRSPFQLVQKWSAIVENVKLTVVQHVEETIWKNG